jgi:hypothetical protein
MSKNQFWQYAKEAILSACYAKTDDDRQGLLELARTWTQAALQERASLVDHDDPAEIRCRIAHQVFFWC